MGNVHASLLELEAGTPKFDWTLLLEETDCGLKGRLEYNADLFVAETIKRLLQHFQILLQGIIADPQRRISEYPLLTSEEEGLLAEWNQTATDYERDACVHEIFAAQVEKTPNATALVFGELQMTYRELNEQADEFAGRLRGMGVGPDVLVGLCLERFCELMVAMLAILKAGGAYVPLDRTYPHERLQFMVQDTALTVLVTDSDFDTSDFKSVKHVIRLGGAPSTRSASSESSDVRVERVLGAPKTTSENLAYVIYTSGSTGTPKGAAIPHRGIVRLVRNTNYVKFSPEDVFLQLAPVSFDASTFEIWGALLNGAKLVIFPPHVPSLEELGRFIQQHGVTTLWLTAGLFHQMVEHQLGSLKSVRQLLAGGDVLSVAHVTKAALELPDCQIINGYGPTENTTFTTCFRVSADCSGGRSVPIGRPISNTQLYVLDTHLAPVPMGVPGELFIGGDGLARGYLNRPELTVEKFIPNPFNKNQKLYRTGDIVRWLPDGNIEFLGRKDSQVKIRGFRIELGEIETALAQYPAVREAVVIVRDTDNGGRQLVAYVVTKVEARFDGAALRKFLEEKLPTYMVPSGFVAVEQMPLTPNGKVDRRALAALDIKQTAATKTFVAPRNSTETKLAEIWREVLARELIGIHDNFFHLGGHSLLAIQIVSRISKVFQTELPVRDIFETPTIAGLAEKIQRQPSAPIASRNGIGRRTSRAQAAQLLQQMDKLSDAEVETLLRSSEASKVS
jgi:aspartate racemase